MLRHLRLAEARGSLRAPNHALQDRALEFLQILTEIKGAEQRADGVRLALANRTVDAERIADFYPEYFPPDPFSAAQNDDGSFDIDKVDDSKIDWDTPTDRTEDDEIAAWIASREATFNADELPTGF